MKTLVIYDATDPVQVTGAALLKKSIGTDFVLSTTVTGTAEKVWNLNDVDTDSFSEDQYEIADEVLGYNFAGLTLETAPTIFTSGTLGKTGLTWEVDEHAGKWCYIKADTTNDLVLIESNTATPYSISPLFGSRCLFSHLELTFLLLKEHRLRV